MKSCPSPQPCATGPLTAAFLSFVAKDVFSCVGAKAALARDAIETREFARLGDPANDAPLLAALSSSGRALDAVDDADPVVRTFVALFEGPVDTSERRFEALLWSQLQRLHDLDVRRRSTWAPDVSRDPEDANFSFSLGGHPFFVIGLHPGASRDARRFASPALVFNSHRQFERLRADGRYAKMQAATRARDLALQGSINPNLADFGEASEARQYSGLATGSGWICPFRPKQPR